MCGETSHSAHVPDQLTSFPADCVPDGVQLPADGLVEAAVQALFQTHLGAAHGEVLYVRRESFKLQKLHSDEWVAVGASNPEASYWRCRRLSVEDQDS